MKIKRLKEIEKAEQILRLTSTINQANEYARYMASKHTFWLHHRYWLEEWGVSHDNQGKE